MSTLEELIELDPLTSDECTCEQCGAPLEPDGCPDPECQRFSEEEYQDRMLSEAQRLGFR